MHTPQHIHDAVRNTLRSIARNLTTPQSRAVKELLVGLLRNSTTILNHLNTETDMRIGKQSERYRRHLENIDIAALVEKHIFRTLPAVEDNTIIAYDLGDIAKPHAKVMEGVHPIFDGSERKSSRGYELHGVSIHHQPVVMEPHDADSKFLPQVREEIIDRITRSIGTKGIWIYDRGNDDEKLFAAHVRRKQRFVIRLKKNRHLIHKNSGMKQSVEDFLPGIYDVRVPKQRWKYTLVVHEHIEEGQKQEPIRVLVRGVQVKKAEEIVEKYLQRWDIENLYKQMKEKFGLEQMRLLSMKKMKNLLALIQLATSISNKAFTEMTKEAEEESTAVFELSVIFKAFCHKRCLTRNRFAFTSFLQEHSPTLRPREREGNPFQRSLLPRHEIRRLERETAEMGVF
jgi:hypothetical protein